MLNDNILVTIPHHHNIVSKSLRELIILHTFQKILRQKCFIFMWVKQLMARNMLSGLRIVLDSLLKFRKCRKCSRERV